MAKVTIVSITAVEQNNDKITFVIELFNGLNQENILSHSQQSVPFAYIRNLTLLLPRSHK